MEEKSRSVLSHVSDRPRSFWRSTGSNVRMETVVEIDRKRLRLWKGGGHGFQRRRRQGAGSFASPKSPSMFTSIRERKRKRESHAKACFLRKDTKTTSRTPRSILDFPDDSNGFNTDVVSFRIFASPHGTRIARWILLHCETKPPFQCASTPRYLGIDPFSHAHVQPSASTAFLVRATNARHDSHLSRGVPDRESIRPRLVCVPGVLRRRIFRALPHVRFGIGIPSTRVGRHEVKT